MLSTFYFMLASWITNAAFYHIYPLGLCAAPRANDFTSPTVPRLDQLYPWIDHILGLNLNAIYLGPVFESASHGYDTADYFQVDRRLGSNKTLKSLLAEMRSRGLRVVLDGVFNHVGRDFWAFRDLQARGEASSFIGWFHGLDFHGTSPYGDPFSYEGWSGHYDLVKLNLANPAVKQHLFDAITMWVSEFGIDGLRLDAADLLDDQFLRDLRGHCRALNPDFWLMGEIIHGDYRHWANPDMLDSVTNYECYKGLYSSHVDRNYYEIAWSLDRQFGEAGIYRDLLLYSFADNHDVNRVASSLSNPAHLYSLYLLLATMPGIPSIYYGSEWGLTGERTDTSDRALRPALDLGQMFASAPQPDLPSAIHQLMGVRHRLPALQFGDYRQLYVDHEQFAFARSLEDQTVIVAVNASDKPAQITLSDIPMSAHFEDKLNAEVLSMQNGRLDLTLPPAWGRILVVC